MIDKFVIWLTRKWYNWEVYSEHYKKDVNGNTDWKIITTLKRKANDGSVEYKIKRNF